MVPSFVLLTLLPWLVHAQSPTFTWSFLNQTVPNAAALESCVPLALSVSGEGVLPYYLRVFVVGGSARLYPLGDDLVWTPDLPNGSQVVLSLIDSSPNGGSGATSPLHTITASSTASCVLELVTPTSTFTLSSNITDSGDLETCAGWGLLTNGGTPPFTFSLMAPNAPIMTNITGDRNDNLLAYVNRASPNGHLVAAVSDATGTFAMGTALVDTVGGTEFECDKRQSVTMGFDSTPPNLSSASSPPSSSSSESSTPSTTLISNSEGSTSTSNKKTVAIALGIVLPLVVIGALIGGYVLWRYRKRRQFQHQTRSNPFLPPALVAPPPPPPIRTDTSTIQRSGSLLTTTDISTRRGGEEKMGMGTVLSPLSEREGSSPVQEVIRIVEVHHHHHHEGGGVLSPSSSGESPADEVPPPPYISR